MADWLSRTPRIVWGDALDRVVDLGQPLDNVHAYDLPGEGSEQARTPAGAVDAWLRPRMYFLEADARWIPGDRSRATGQPASGWYNDNAGWRDFIAWAQDAKLFYLHPDNRNLVVIPELAVDTSADGIADGWVAASSGLNNLTGETRLMEGGRQKLLFTGSSGQGDIGVSQRIYGVHEGDVVSASVELEVADLTLNGRAQLVLEFLDAASAVITSATTTVTANQAASRITNNNRTAPALTDSVRFEIRARSVSTGGGSITTWWKDAVLERKSAASGSFIPNDRYGMYLLAPFNEKPFELEDDGTAMTRLKMLFSGAVNLDYLNTP